MKQMNFMLHELPIKIMLEIRKNNRIYTSSYLSKKVGCCQSSCIKEIGKLKGSKLLETQKDGRKKIIHLTKKGEELSDDLLFIERI